MGLDRDIHGSIMEMKGWYSANQRTPRGIEPVGTNPLPRKGSSTRGRGRLLAVSTLLVTRPHPTENQVRARLIITRTPTAASHSTGPAVGINPTSRATPMTTARPNIVCIMLPRTCPVSTDGRKISMVRNRAMIPSVMSMATAIAVP